MDNEILETLQQMKNDKAAKEDVVMIEVLKYIDWTIGYTLHQKDIPKKLRAQFVGIMEQYA